MKKILAAFILIVMLLCLVACGNQGGEATNKDTSDSEYEIAVVVKIKGIGYFDVFEKGVEYFSSETGINAYVEGPEKADADAQVEIIRSLIDSDVDAIVVVPNDADAVAEVLKEAQEKGIVTVTTESPDQEGADYDVEMIINETYADLVAEDAATRCGGEGQYAIYVGSLTVPLHNAWADEVESYLSKNYPDMSLVCDRIPCGEDAEEAYAQANDLIDNNKDLNAFICFGSQGPLGVAKAITEKDLIGKITVVGCIIPSESSSYLESGAITTGYLWNPADSGYAACYIAKTLLDGDTIDESFTIPSIDGDISFDGKTLWIDNPITITAENRESFGF